MCAILEVNVGKAYACVSRDVQAAELLLQLTEDTPGSKQTTQFQRHYTSHTHTHTHAC
jgi:hypothetical protein